MLLTPSAVARSPGCWGLPGGPLATYWADTDGRVLDSGLLRCLPLLDRGLEDRRGVERSTGAEEVEFIRLADHFCTKAHADQSMVTIVGRVALMIRTVFLKETPMDKLDLILQETGKSRLAIEQKIGALTTEVSFIEDEHHKLVDKVKSSEVKHAILELSSVSQDTEI
ncbi:hypothetical protein NDU88_007120 [Pleurodeles waltl]|uniref:Uncharacterized protein n=1 Tax=Pleurodeles waltl TaxID=8319 RepID=A0AAV7N181_PLEWA|nr:hypothetical protein NDU88_007120 [Pleurodeles waltl]